MSDEIEALIQAENWPEARRLIESALRGEPDSHWLITRLALTYYEEFEYETALKYEEQALQLAPRCPLVLWGYAGALHMLSREKEAIEVFHQIINRRLDSLAFDDCGEGLFWARGLIADCHYRLAKCYRSLGNKSEAISHYEKHLSQRGSGCGSIYSKKMVRKELKELLSA